MNKKIPYLILASIASIALAVLIAVLLEMAVQVILGFLAFCIFLMIFFGAATER